MFRKYSLVMLVLVAASVLPVRSVPSAEDVPVRIAKFDIDVTPPVGFMMAYDRVVRVEELGLRARGVVITGAGEPIVLCAIDWIGIGNGGQDAFRDTLAKAAGTIRERVAVHTLHQHDAPRCDLTAEQLLHQAGVSDLGPHDGSLGTGCSQAFVGGGANGHRRGATDHARRLWPSRGQRCCVQSPRGRKRKSCCDSLYDDPRSEVAGFAQRRDRSGLEFDFVLERRSSRRRADLLRLPSAKLLSHRRSQSRLSRDRAFLRGQDVPNVLHVHFNGAGATSVPASTTTVPKRTA